MTNVVQIHTHTHIHKVKINKSPTWRMMIVIITICHLLVFSFFFLLNYSSISLIKIKKIKFFPHCVYMMMIFSGSLWCHLDSDSKYSVSVCVYYSDKKNWRTGKYVVSHMCECVCVCMCNLSCVCVCVHFIVFVIFFRWNRIDTDNNNSSQ